VSFGDVVFGVVDGMGVFGVFGVFGIFFCTRKSKNMIWPGNWNGHYRSTLLTLLTSDCFYLPNAIQLHLDGQVHGSCRS